MHNKFGSKGRTNVPNNFEKHYLTKKISFFFCINLPKSHNKLRKSTNYTTPGNLRTGPKKEAYFLNNRSHFVDGSSPPSGCNLLVIALVLTT